MDGGFEFGIAEGALPDEEAGDFPVEGFVAGVFDGVAFLADGHFRGVGGGVDGGFGGGGGFGGVVEEFEGGDAGAGGHASADEVEGSGGEDGA